MPTINGPSPLTDNQINNQAFSTQTLVAFVFRSRASLLHDQVTGLASQITQSTNDIKELSAALAKAKELEAAGSKASSAQNTFDYLIGKFKIDGFRFDDKKYWPANETIIQGLIDEQTNYSSQLSTKLQNLSNKYNNAFDVVKSFIEDINSDASDILSKVG